MKSKLALFEPVSNIDDGPRPHLNHAAVLHTAVSNASDLYSYWKSGAAGPGVGAHFYINEKGDIYQYLDTTRKTGHAYAANEFAVGIETWDGGDSTIPWNSVQIDSIVALLLDMGIPAKALKETPSDGVGFHREYPSWNLSGHTCPGDARAKQVSTVIIPRLAQGGDDLTPDEHAMLANLDAYRQQKMKRHGIDPAAHGANDALAKIEAQAERAALGLTPSDGTKKTPVPSSMPSP